MVISPLEHPNTATGDPWATQPKYSNAIAATAAALILLSTLTHHLITPSLSRRTLALHRYLTHLPRSVTTITIITLCFLIPFTTLTFAVKPYYRTLSVYGSPPLALRAGFLALGTLPFLYATSAKVSYLTTLTGVKTETWLVWHAWGARFAMFLATVHTIPFIYQAVQEGGSTQLAYIFKSDNIYTTGILAYVALAVLVLPSSRIIRQRCYALWLAIHIPIALVFLVAMWVHCENILTSWRFMYAATFFYLLNIALRVSRWSQHSDFLMHTTVHLSVLPSSTTTSSSSSGSLTRITVPTMARWKPGQHIYLRLFPSLPNHTQRPYSLFSFLRFWFRSALHSHPFTIVSLPPEDRHAPLGHMVLLARATGSKGWTGALAEWVGLLGSDGEEEGGVCISAQWTAIVDGPYGSISTPSLLGSASNMLSSFMSKGSKSPNSHERHIAELERRSPLARHDGVLFVCGGSGITFPLGLLLELVWARSKAEGLTLVRGAGKEGGLSVGGEERRWPRKVHFVWSVRDEAHIAWAEEQLRIASELVNGDWLEIIIHVTGHSSTQLPSTAPTPLRPTGPSRTVSSTTSSEPQEEEGTDGGSSKKSGGSAIHADVEEAAFLSEEVGAVPILEKGEQDHHEGGGDHISPLAWIVRRGERIEPDLVLRDFLGSLSTPGATTGVVVCGPVGLADDMVRAVNGVQMDILRGRGTDVGGGGGGVGVIEVGELEVFREDFGW